MDKEINLAFDIETNGIDSTRLHCIVTQDLDTGLVEEYNDEKYSDQAKELPMSNHSITTALTSLMSAMTSSPPFSLAIFTLIAFFCNNVDALINYVLKDFVCMSVLIICYIPSML